MKITHRLSVFSLIDSGFPLFSCSVLPCFSIPVVLNTKKARLSLQRISLQRSGGLRDLKGVDFRGFRIHPL